MKLSDQACEKLYRDADLAGAAAVHGLRVTPMVVQQHVDMLNDKSPVTKEWVVPDGPCGFAWVNVKPGNSKFAKWLKAKGYAHADSYEKGVSMSIFSYNQSIQKKACYAAAFAEVLRNAGINAYSNSRMD
jgi:hypothetical protein